MNSAKAKPHLVVLRGWFPLFKRATGDWHLCNVLQCLSRHYNIHLLIEAWGEAENRGMRDEALRYLRDQGYSVSILTDFTLCATLRHSRVAAVMLCQERTAASYLVAVRSARPDLPVVYFDLDAYYIGMRMRAERENDPELLREAEISHRRQKNIIQAVDATLLVSADEAKLFENEVPGATVIPTPVVVASRETDISRRIPGTLVFACNMRYSANQDALRYFLTQIYPRIFERMADVTINIIGADPPPELQVLTEGLHGVHLLGYVPDLSAELDRAWISIAPLTWGSGIKGKVIEAMATGLPVVTTSIGIQGLSVHDGEEVLVADDPESFAHAVERLTRDTVLHRKLATQAQSYVAEHLSPAFLQKQVDTLATLLASTSAKVLPDALREALLREKEAPRSRETVFDACVAYIMEGILSGVNPAALWSVAVNAARLHPQGALKNFWLFRRLAQWSVKMFYSSKGGRRADRAVL